MTLLGLELELWVLSLLPVATLTELPLLQPHHTETHCTTSGNKDMSVICVMCCDTELEDGGTVTSQSSASNIFIF
jgi:hypothetical protein